MIAERLRDDSLSGNLSIMNEVTRIRSAFEPNDPRADEPAKRTF